jgi:hypothetical protein
VADNRHVFGGLKLLHSQIGVHRSIVVMEHPVVRAPFDWPLPPHVHHKQPQTVTQLRIDGLTWRDEFLTDNPVNFEKADQH